MGIDHGHIAALREWWGRDYEITWVWQAQVFRAVSRKGGRIIEDAEPEELWVKIRADHITSLTMKE